MRRVFIITMAAMLMIQVNAGAQQRVSTQGRTTAAQAKDNRGGNTAATAAGRRGANDNKVQPQAVNPQTPSRANQNNQHTQREVVAPKPQAPVQMHKAEAPKNRPNNHGFTIDNGVRSGRRGTAGTQYHYGNTVPMLKNYNVVTHAGLRYYYVGNTYYRMIGNRYVTCRPPVGVTVALDYRDLWYTRIGNKDYYFDDFGVFYRRKGNGLYKVVEAPIGAVIPFIPFDYKLVHINGMHYYQVENVLYRAVNHWGEQGYEVVRRILW
ncbi:MAG: hypothetical protein MJZ16_05665 [Bacteroidales bacterium]|nr:hypothetical protein [Bacteroidales bacterium]